MTVLIWGMLLALLIPIAVVCRPCSVWDRMAAFSSIAAPIAVTSHFIARLRWSSGKPWA